MVRTKATSVVQVRQEKMVGTKAKSLGPGKREGAVPERMRQEVRMAGAAIERDRGERKEDWWQVEWCVGLERLEAGCATDDGGDQLDSPVLCGACNAVPVDGCDDIRLCLDDIFRLLVALFFVRFV